MVTTVTDDQSCGLLGLPRSSYDATFIVQKKSGNIASITEKAARCRFDAAVTGQLFTATSTECVLADDSPARELGVYRELFDEFAMDVELGTFHSTVQHWQKVNAGSGHSCAVAEGREVGRATAHHYATTYKFFEDRPSDATDCGKARVYGDTSGYLQVSADDAGELSLHWEGVGCDVKVLGPAEGPWSAEHEPCVMSADALAPFAITAIDIDALDYDPQAEALTAKGRMTRDNGSTFCFEISAP